MVKIELMQAFVAVIETNSFVAAAKKLKKSSAAISQKINALEKQLKVELIKRDTRNLEITPIGQAYYDQCKKIFQEMDKAKKLIKTQQIEPSGKLKVVCPVRSLVPKIVQFRDIYPDIELIVDCNERMPDFSKEKVDIVVGTLAAPPDVVAKVIGKTRYCLCGSKNYFKKFGKPKTPHELIQHRYIAHSMRFNDTQLSFDEGRITVPVQPWVWLNNTHAMLECAKHDLGLISLHSIMIQDAIDKGELIEIFAELQTDESLYLYYPYSEYLEPKIRLFVEFLDSQN
jgi:DNA-binding transcriptional LysR family regulator